MQETLSNNAANGNSKRLTRKTKGNNLRIKGADVYVETDLGRKVLMTDWKSYYKDSLLLVLHNIANGRSGMPIPLATVTELSGAIALDRKRARELCDYLVQHKYIKEYSKKGFVIDSKGTRYVSDLLMRGLGD